MLIIGLLLSALLIFLQVEDVLTTNKILSQGGTELNPVMKIAQKVLGKYWWASKILFCLPVAFVFPTPTVGSLVALAILDAVFVFVVVSNYRQIK